MEVYVVCFQGVPTISFSDYKDLLEYFEAQGTDPSKVRADMTCNNSPKWEWYKLACDGPDYKEAYNALMEYWDSMSNSQQKELTIILKGLGFDDLSYLKYIQECTALSFEEWKEQGGC